MEIDYMLREGTVLQGKYRIKKFLASGGFGNTYVATHLEMEKDVAVKEFFIKGVNHREGDSCSVSVSNSSNTQLFDSQKQKFKKEAQRLFSLTHPNIIRVFDLFEENNTVYYIMDYVEGESLSEKVKHQGGPFSEPEVMTILGQLLDALEAVHGHSLLHMDIKPGNILMDNTGRCTLIDFGSSKQVDNGGGMTTTTSLSYTPGYAPPEQVNGSKDKWGPYTDFYALGATLYNLLSGKKPPTTEDIFENGNSAFVFPNKVSDKSIYLITWLMSPRISVRPQSVKAIRNFLEQYDQHSIEATERNDVEITKYPGVHTSFSSMGVAQNDKTLYGNRRENSYQAPSRSQKSNLTYWLSGFLFVLILIALILGFKNCKKDKAPAVVENPSPVIENAVPQNEAPSPVKNEEVKIERKTFEANGVAFTMIKVYGGDFMMGATNEQSGSAESNESPVHQVTLDSYMIGETEVTQALWKSVMGKNPSHFTGNNQRPVESVSWSDCQTFLNKLNSMTGQSFRLPTEAEWEYAARGGMKSKGYKYSGSNNIYEVAWYNGNAWCNGNEYDPDYGTHSVGIKRPNELEIYDMSGNVWEWCVDWFGYYSSDPQSNPQGPSSGSEHIVRGGRWYGSEKSCRVSYRGVEVTSMRSPNIGFRLAL